MEKQDLTGKMRGGGAGSLPKEDTEKDQWLNVWEPGTGLPWRNTPLTSTAGPCGLHSSWIQDLVSNSSPIYNVTELYTEKWLKLYSLCYIYFTMHTPNPYV